MKQKIVIRLSMNDDKSRSKALKTVVGVSKHLESAALIGTEKNQLEVVGEGIDAVVLTRALRKNVAHADLVSVTEDKKSEEKKGDTKKKNEAPVPPPDVWYSVPCYNGHHYPIHVVREPSYDPCTIM
ncbi:heavy metal-associated isoprenylated plant protein 46-like [Olea europaea var. sylvestris]|uniref:heavy metal-associated isoprenylated plant protein 46-like n=1 Tax=Olea europaea var. sylvestris TaxID=158386 RepID=UPI000C1D0CB9|nr:heavy metal-associated isoprenylated plant protein 46-like [Olea europaea var. sylvestris]